MTLPRPSAVIFDMDGTTVRHLNPWVLHVLEVADDAIYRGRLVMARLTGGAMGRFHFRRARRKKPRLIAHRALHKMRRKSVEEIVEPCPGVIDLLELFRDNNIPVGLVSNGLGQGYGHDILERFELAPFFKTSVFREDILRSKPDPEAIVTALDRMGLMAAGEGEAIWYIGDRAKDIVAALSADPQVKARIVPIGYGLHAAMAVFERGLPAENLVLSYEDWYHDVAAIIAGTAGTTTPPAVVA